MKLPALFYERIMIPELLERLILIARVKRKKQAVCSLLKIHPSLNIVTQIINELFPQKTSQTEESAARKLKRLQL